MMPLIAQDFELDSDLIVMIAIVAFSVIGGIIQKTKGDKKDESKKPTLRRGSTSPQRERTAQQSQPARGPLTKARPATSSREKPASSTLTYTAEELRDARRRAAEQKREQERDQERIERLRDQERRSAQPERISAVKPSRGPSIEDEAAIPDIEQPEPASQSPVRARRRPRTAAVKPLEGLLSDRTGLQAGFVLTEILQKPVALREDHLRR